MTAHFLMRTGKQPLGHGMRSLLTGYAGAFNRRHKRHGHLLQNRYKSVVVEEPYLLEFVRYLELVRRDAIPAGARERTLTSTASNGRGTPTRGGRMRRR